MRKLILIIASLFLLNVSHTFGQETQTSIDYVASGIYLVFTDKAGVEEARKPMGKNVSISYDKFFKSYTIIYTDENGYATPLSLKYINDENYIKNVKTTKMDDKFGNIYYVTDMLEQIGLLKILMSKEYPGGRNAWFVIEEAKETVQ